MTYFITLIKTVVFNDIKFNRMFTETFSFRKFHILILEENGYVREGILRDHIMESGKFYDLLFME